MREFDLVVEGDAHRIEDPPIVAGMAERWPRRVGRAGWPRRDARSPPTTVRPRPVLRRGFVYRISPRSATALAILEPGVATRWRF